MSSLGGSSSLGGVSSLGGSSSVPGGLDSFSPDHLTTAPTSSSHDGTEGRAPPSILTTPSPNDPLGISSSNSSSHLYHKMNLSFSSSNSNSSLAPVDSQESSLSRPNSRGPPPSHSPTPSPTPSSVTHSSHPVQPVSANPAKNRFKMIQKLSSFKQAAKHQESPPPSHTAAVDCTLNSLAETDTLNPPSLEQPLTTQSLYSTANQRDKTDVLHTAAHPRAIDTDISRSLWTSDSFTDMPMEDFTNDSNWPSLANQNQSNGNPVLEESRIDPQPPLATSETSYQQSSRKRLRSPSPFVSEQAVVPRPPHKKHKSHKSSSKISRPDMSSASLVQCVVQIPLEKVFLNHLAVRKELTDEPVSLNERVNPVLVVSIERSMLSRVPGNTTTELQALGETLKGWQSHDQSHHSHELNYQSHDQFHGSRQSHDPKYQSYDLDHHTHDKSGHWTDLVTNRTVKTEDPDQFTQSPKMPRLPPPEGACPGVDGCIGLDGYWYNWTEHISSHENEVTIMPYIYIEDTNS